jgi:hypothetical protein
MVAPRGRLSHCAVFGSFEPAPVLRDADFAVECRERACIAHFHGTAFHGMYTIRDASAFQASSPEKPRRFRH